MNNLRKGFTLIELLIVIAIIGVLAVAFLPSLMDAPAKARDAQRIEQVNKIANFLLLEYTVNGSVPAKGASGNILYTSAVGHLIDANLADFGGVFPEDPDSATHYVYINTGSKTYACAVAATVENIENGNITNLNKFMVGTEALSDSGKYYVVAVQK